MSLTLFVSVSRIDFQLPERRIPDGLRKTRSDTGRPTRTRSNPRRASDATIASRGSWIATLIALSPHTPISHGISCSPRPWCVRHPASTVSRRPSWLFFGFASRLLDCLQFHCESVHECSHLQFPELRNLVRLRLSYRSYHVLRRGWCGNLGGRGHDLVLGLPILHSCEFLCALTNSTAAASASSVVAKGGSLRLQIESAVLLLHEKVHAVPVDNCLIMIVLVSTISLLISKG